MQPPPKRRRWTDEEDALVVRLRDEAVPAEEIARRLGRTNTQVTHRFSKLVARGLAKPMSRSERARRAALATRAGRTDLWTADQDALVVELFRAGSSVREIASVIGRPFRSVENRMQKLRAHGLVLRLDASERKVRERRARAAMTDEKHEQARALLHSIERTDAFGYVVGCLYGDASVETTRMSILMKATNASFVESFARALERCFGETVARLSRIEPIKRVGGREYRDVTYYEAYLHRRHIVAAVVEILGNTTKLGWSLDVEAALRRGPAFCTALIRGLFDSDGSFHRVGSRGVSIRYGSTNERGVRDVYQLLLRLGFDVGLGGPTRKGERRIGIRMQSAERYAIEVSSGIDYKREVLDGFLSAR
jgi:predicted transcriptional regulator